MRLHSPGTAPPDLTQLSRSHSRARETPSLLPTRALIAHARDNPPLLLICAPILLQPGRSLFHAMQHAGMLSAGPGASSNRNIAEMHRSSTSVKRDCTWCLPFRTAKGTMAIGASGNAGCSATNEDTREPQDGGTKGVLRWNIQFLAIWKYYFEGSSFSNSIKPSVFHRLKLISGRISVEIEPLESKISRFGNVVKQVYFTAAYETVGMTPSETHF
ncbi:hypothetical protein C8R44DRAFT_754393 [Mycena epipterygia]|nr:hypothetical protein C8R44DRAFT_754393 [Mycena epipterygia]